MPSVATRLAEATATLEADLARLHALSEQSVVVAASWSALSAITGTVTHQLAEVPDSDAGTHTDPVVGGTVANAGRFRWSIDPAGWLWLGEFQNGVYSAFGEASGDGLAYSCSTDESWSTTVAGRTLSFRCPATNTGNCTLNVNTVGAISLRDNRGNQIAPGFLKLDSHYLARVHSGTQIRVLTVAGVADALVATDAGADPSALALVGVEGGVEGGALKTISWSNLIAFIEAQLMPPTYSYPGSLSLDTVDTTIVADTGDDQLIELWGQNTGPGRVAIAFGDDIPEVDGLGSITLEPGQPFSMDRLRQGEVRAIADQTAGLSLTIVTTGAVNPNSTLAQDVHIRRYTSLTDPLEAALRTLYASLFSAGIIARAAGGFLGIFSGANSADRLLNWSGSGSFSLVDAPVGSWLNYTFDGSNDALDSGIVFSDPATANDHTAAVYTTGASTQGSGKYALGDSQLRVGPNRTATQATIHDFSSAQVVTVGALNGLVGTTRIDAAEITVFRGASSQVVTLANNGLFPSASCYVGGAHTSGLVGPYTGAIAAAYRGRALDADQVAAMDAAIAAYLVTAAGF